ncbi:MAG: YiiD C-terminal domain-containing protein [Planctomycetota bacterium]
MSSLADLQRVLDAEIPMCGQMGVRVLGLAGDADAGGGDAGEDGAAGGLAMAMPLDRNRNHQLTAFAGSLNALCTIAGWGATYLLAGEARRDGAIVILRSSIKYHRPVESPSVVARCTPPAPDARDYFHEMLRAKGQAKLDLAVQIAAPGPAQERPAVAFQGSYVVTLPGSDA